EAGLKIDPAAAEVEWEYGQPGDPYGINPDLPEEMRQVGRVYFARSPGSDIWVCFGDLPAATRTALWERHKEKLASCGLAHGGMPLSWFSFPARHGVSVPMALPSSLTTVRVASSALVL